MRRAALLAALLLSACGEKAPPPAQSGAHPSADAVGAELASFAQILVPIVPASLDEYKRAAEFRGGEANVGDGDVSLSYSRGASVVAGSTITVFVGYAGAWLMPVETTARPMTPLQFLRALDSAVDCAGAVVLAPRGKLYVPREQLMDVTIAAQKADAPAKDAPLVLIRGSAR